MGISAPTAWRWRNAGLITTVQIGRLLFITKDEAEKFENRAVSGEFTARKIAGGVNT